MTVTNCPNCGAPIETDKCPYCGTIFIDFTCMDTEKPFYMKVRTGNGAFIARVCMASLSITTEPEYLYADNLRMCGYSNTTIDASFQVIDIHETEEN